MPNSALPLPRKRFGQHFLLNQGVLHKIADAAFSAIPALPHAPLLWLEIGPGQGALTEHLLQQLTGLTEQASTQTLAQLHVLEIDRDLVQHLQQRFAAYLSSSSRPALYVHEGDCLAFDFAQLLPASPKPNSNTMIDAINNMPRLVLIGNLPYNVSTPLLFRLIAYKAHVVQQVFMLQKEVVQRMVAAAGSELRGRLSVMLQYHYDMDSLFDVQPGSFFPPPKVQSAVVRMRPLDTAYLSPQEYALFSRLVQTAFAQRRKMLRRSLADFSFVFTDNALAHLASARPQDITQQDWIAITKAAASKMRDDLALPAH